jgi:shikimate kinase
MTQKSQRKGRNPPPARRHVVLVGLMGSGKTTIGRELGLLLARPLVDNDEQMLKTTGLTVAEISERAGVAEMRRLESDALDQALGSPVPAVITAAAGVVLDERVRHRLREAFVVWLRAAPETLATRVARGPARPLLGDDPLAVLREMERQRHHLYAEVADLTIDVDWVLPAEAADRIADQVLVALEARNVDR